MIRLLTYGVDEVYTFKEFSEKSAPDYAILSHTWSQNIREELTIHDIRSRTAYTKPWGYGKLEFIRKQAVSDKIEYFWIDTCCINKDSTAELSYSLNCMFKWYQRAQRCYVFLADVSYPAETFPGQQLEVSWEAAFRNSRWFTRGWTLQELIAPRAVEFFSNEGRLLGTRTPGSLGEKIHSLTRIRPEVLQGGVLLHECSVAERWLWSAGRETSEEEDEAYCLQGIFGVAIGSNPGEGLENAQVRLWKAIMEERRVAIVEVARALLVHVDERRDATGKLAQKVSRRAKQIRRLRARLAKPMREIIAANRGNNTLLEKLKAQGARSTMYAVPTSSHHNSPDNVVEDPVAAFASLDDAKSEIKEQSKEVTSLEPEIEEEMKLSLRAGCALQSIRAPLSHFVDEEANSPGGATLSMVEKVATRNDLEAINRKVDQLDRDIEALLKEKQELLKEKRELSKREAQLQAPISAETGKRSILPKRLLLLLFIFGNFVLIMVGVWYVVALNIMIGIYCLWRD